MVESDEDRGARGTEWSSFGDVLDFTHFFQTITQHHSTMPQVTVDAKFFPHIIDEIFAQASRSTLLALRINREWRKRAERMLAYHVRVTETVTDSESLPRKTPIVQSSDGDMLGVIKVGSPDSAAPVFLSSTVVIDLHVPNFDKKVAPILTHCSSNVAVRCHNLCRFYSPVGLTPKIGRVVLFFKDDALHGRDGFYSRYRLNRIPGPKQLVLHLRSHGRADASYFLDIRDSFGELGGMTLILHPREPTRWNFGPHSLEYKVESQLSFLADFVVFAYVKNVPVTVVNLACRKLEGLDEQVYSYEDVKNTLLERITRAKQGYTSYPVGSVYTPVRFLSLDEYRAEVGEELFQIDTNEGRLWPPHLLYQ